MTHLEIENLASDYLEGLLEPSLRVSVDAHLNGCAECRELMGDVRHVMEMCQAAEDVEPTPWLVPKILRATIGERKPTLRERIAAYIRPVLQPRVAYPIAMTVFTFSILVNAAGLNLRSLRFEDLNPRIWVDRANRQGHLMYAHAEKFYYDLRVVYEIESRFRQLRGQPSGQEEAVPKPAAPGGGSSEGAPSDQTMASNAGAWTEAVSDNEPAFPTIEHETGFTRARRSPIP
jgi:hypothetical protein